MFSPFFLGALYLEHVLGYSAIETGLAFLPMTLGIGVLSVGVTPRLLTRFGPKRTLIPGLAMAFAGLAIFARVPSTPPTGPTSSPLSCCSASAPAPRSCRC